jgi:hypothetical protein
MTEPAAAGPAASWMRRLAEDDAPATRPSPWGPVILLVLAVLWLGGILRSAAVTMADNGGDASIAISSAALSLPGILTAVLLAGAATGLVAVVRFGGLGRVRRLLVGGGGGAVIGAATGTLVLVMFGANAAITVIAVTIALAGILGGAAAALPAGPITAGIMATLAYYVFSTVVNLFQSPLKGLLGAGETTASQLGAASRFALLTALLSGLVIGLVAYVSLQRSSAASLSSPTAAGLPSPPLSGLPAPASGTEAGLAWPWYLFAGAAPGLVALVAEGLTRLGGSGLLGIVSGFSPADRLVLSYLGGERLKAALIIMFAGGIVAMISVGRTLRRPAE